MTQREAFEAYWNKPKQYKSKEAMAWDSWQAAQAQAAVEPVAWMLDAPKHPGAYLHKCNETDYEIERLSVFLKDGTLMVGSDIGTMDVAHYHAGLTDPMWAEIDIPPNHVAAMRLALDSLLLSRDDVYECKANLMPKAGYPRYDRQITAYEEQLEKHDDAIAALEGIV